MLDPLLSFSNSTAKLICSLLEGYSVTILGSPRARILIGEDETSSYNGIGPGHRTMHYFRWHVSIEAHASEGDLGDGRKIRTAFDPRHGRAQKRDSQEPCVWFEPHIIC